MKFTDWLFCKIHHICTTHRIQKLFKSGPGGKGWYDCPECEKEAREVFNAKYKELGIRR